MGPVTQVFEMKMLLFEPLKSYIETGMEVWLNKYGGYNYNSSVSQNKLICDVKRG